MLACFLVLRKAHEPCSTRKNLGTATWIGLLDSVESLHDKHRYQIQRRRIKGPNREPKRMFEKIMGSGTFVVGKFSRLKMGTRCILRLSDDNLKVITTYRVYFHGLFNMEILKLWFNTFNSQIIVPVYARKSYLFTPLKNSYLGHFKLPHTSRCHARDLTI